MPRKWSTRSLRWGDYCTFAVRRHLDLFPRHCNSSSQFRNVIFFFDGRIPLGIPSLHFNDSPNWSNSPIQQERHHFVTRLNFLKAVTGIDPASVIRWTL